MPDLKIVVIGAGVIGLTTAIELQKVFRNAEIDMIAESFFEKTTSFVAAGVFRPGTSFAGPNDSITRKWINESYYYWNDLFRSNSKCSGITEISGYIFAKEHKSIVRNEFIENLVPIYRQATEEELKICSGDWKYGSFFQTLRIDCTDYLPYVANIFRSNHGKIKQQKVKSLLSHNFRTKYDIVVNCTGFGAKVLCGDRKLVPIRGQVLKVKAPWIKHFYYGDYDTYIIPGQDSITLGGCRQFDSYDMSINDFDTKSIRSRCENLLSNLKDAKLLEIRVGLRPHRDPVRVEGSIENGTKIVHNYGHGGYGVTTAPGTALHAVKCAKDLWTSNLKSKL